MAKLGEGFDSDAKKHGEMNSYDAIPPGDYVVKIIESDYKKVKPPKKGHFVMLCFKILDGEYANKRVYERYNIDNPNTQTVEIAKKAFAACCRAVGKKTVQDTNILHNIPLTIKVKVSKGNGDFPESNDIIGYEAEGASKKASSDDSSETKESSGGSAKPPWAKKKQEEE